MIETNEALTRKVADLARLELSDEEVRTFTPQLGDILKYVESLGEAKVEGVEPLTHPLELPTPFREDEVRPFPAGAGGQPRVLDCAPESLDGGFKVPPIL